MLEFIKKNKYEIILYIIIIGLFTYCGLRTFVINDDLPYSLFYRGDSRISSIGQIIQNQMSDYLTINGRFFIHCVVQFVLMFEKNLFSILNAICIVVTIFFMKKIIILKSKDFNIKKIYILFLLFGLFLLLGDYKYLIYWVAGSVNYIWLFTLIIGFIYYYLLKGLDKYKVLNCILFFGFSMLHECSFVFILFLIVFDLIKNIVEKKIEIKSKKIFLYLLYIVLSILGGLVVLKAPGNAARMSTTAWWYDMSLIDRLCKSIPVVSLNLFKIFNIDNLIPTIFLVLLAIYGIKQKSKVTKVFSILIILCSIFSFIFNNGWIYFVLSILVCANLLIINYLNDNNDMNVLTMSFYAVVFSMIITPEYFAARPNYYMYIWMIINIVLFINYITDNKIIIKLIQIFSILLVLFTGIREYKIYTYIGNVQSDRLKQIELVKKNNLKVIKYKKIDEKYAKYHPDANLPSDSSYWAYNYFLTYYKLPKDVEIELVY